MAAEVRRDAGRAPAGCRQQHPLHLLARRWMQGRSRRSAYTAALRVRRMDPRTGEEEPGWAGRCGIACYDCLLSYSNQLDHRYVNRYRVRDLLLALQTAVTEPLANARDYEGRHRWLWERLDPASSSERGDRGCVFVDGPAHDVPERAAHDRVVREEVEERGYRVICLRYDRPLPAQVAAYPEVFGPVAPADLPQPNG